MPSSGRGRRSRLRLWWLSALMASGGVGCAPIQPTPPDWLKRMEIPGVTMDSTNRPVFAFTYGGSLLGPAFHAPQSRVTVLADGIPRSMRGTAIAWIPMPPQGRDTLDEIGRRVLELWSDEGPGESMVASLPFSPGFVGDRRSRSSCCTREDLRELHGETGAALDITGEMGWHAERGTLSISPPSITGRCSRALQRRIDGWGDYRAACYSATFEISMDLMFVQRSDAEAARPVRTRAIRRTIVRGVALMLDCARSRGETAFCGPQDSLPE